MATKQTTRNGSSNSNTTAKKRKSEAPPAPKASVSAQPASLEGDGMQALKAAPAARAPEDGMTSRSTPSHDDIALRAFSLYQARGDGGGDPIDDWLTAERELTR